VRGLLTHDLWHVLTGYDTDRRGETYLLAFSLAQLPGRAIRLLTFGAGLRGLREEGVGLVRAMYVAWQRGRRAVWLPALPYEALRLSRSMRCAHSLLSRDGLEAV
jgi:ubiquinone biosynthesis protein Coq4